MIIRIIALLLFTTSASAEHHATMEPHWYDGQCCNEHDCRPVELGELTFAFVNGEAGWQVDYEGQSQWIPEIENGVRNRRLRQSQDNQNHICRGQRSDFTGKSFVRCLYIAPSGN